jgi:hypothetical protein
MKIVINGCYGGFSVSEAVYKELGKEWEGYGFLCNKDFGIVSDNYDAFRSNPKLIAAIEKVGVETAGGFCASLGIVEIPDGVDWYISDYDGIETVHENHRSWE